MGEEQETEKAFGNAWPKSLAHRPTGPPKALLKMEAKQSLCFLSRCQGAMPAASRASKRNSTWKCTFLPIMAICGFRFAECR